MAARDLLRGPLRLGVHRPEVRLGQAGVPREVGEGALAGHQGAPVRVEPLERGRSSSSRTARSSALYVAASGPVLVGVRRVELGERVRDVRDVDDGGVRATSTRAGSPRPSRAAGLDRDGRHAVAHGHVRGVQPGDEPLEPRLEAQPVVEHQVGRGRAAQVVRRRLVAVDLDADVGHGLHPQAVAGDLPGHVGEDGEGREDHRTGVVAQVVRRPAGAADDGVAQPASSRHPATAAATAGSAGVPAAAGVGAGPTESSAYRTLTPGGGGARRAERAARRTGARRSRRRPAPDGVSRCRSRRPGIRCGLRPAGRPAAVPRPVDRALHRPVAGRPSGRPTRRRRVRLAERLAGADGRRPVRGDVDHLEVEHPALARGRTAAR